MKHIFSINRHDAPITHTLQQLKNATGSMPLDGLLLFITFSWLCNSVTVVIVQLKLTKIYAVYRSVKGDSFRPNCWNGEKVKYDEKLYIERTISQQLHEKCKEYIYFVLAKR